MAAVQLQEDNTNLTKEKKKLQTSFSNLTEERNQLQTSYNNLTEERNQLQTSYNNLTEERNQLQTSYNNLTEERNQLQTKLTTCSNGWTKFSSSCYFISSESKNWDESRQDCLRRGADLVIINSREEQVRHGDTLWIGLSDRVREGEWRWVDGSGLNYRSWAKGEPNDAGGREDCGELVKGLDAWNDLPCSDGRPWICEKKTPVHPVGI
uniref:C-type lectin domain-containing protein n=1 Tax=Myripristis murdjan TaxID=586833 RepID=A0A668AQ50_9TELE